MSAVDMEKSIHGCSKGTYHERKLKSIAADVIDPELAAGHMLHRKKKKNHTYIHTSWQFVVFTLHKMHVFGRWKETVVSIKKKKQGSKCCNSFFNPKKAQEKDKILMFVNFARYVEKLQKDPQKHLICTH